VINFVFFTANFPGLGFIDEVWPGYMADHFRVKLFGIAEQKAKGHITVDVMMSFFFSLSLDNQVKMVEWIENNYHFSKIHNDEN